jgi:L-ascorbate metabolism protein UlaG (beta-lactamase superfamily)
MVPPGVRLADLPIIDAVLLSHDHYDHLDDASVRTIRDRFGDRTHWFTPIGYTAWLARRRITNVTELEWWDTAAVEAQAGAVHMTALPAMHWSRRGLFEDSGRQWASWGIDSGSAGRVYFGGDSGYFDGFAEIGKRVGPFIATLLPIGAYEPRWFMKAAHMDPDEAVQAWTDLGAEGRFVAMHWGTFMLTDEPVLEPPVRTRRAWDAIKAEPAQLSILRHGETIILESGPTRNADDG